MSIITLEKVNIFSTGKELYELILILPKLWLTISVIPLFFTYKIFNLITNFIKQCIIK